MLILALSCAAALLAIAALAVALGRAARASPIVYAASLAASLVLLAGALVRLVADPAQISTLTLPIGLPGLGAARPPASTRSAMAGTNERRGACCRSLPPISPA